MPKQLHALVEDRNHARDIQRWHWPRWGLNAAAYQGQYWVAWDRHLSQVKQLRRSEDRVYSAQNFVKRFVRQDVANLTNTRPRFYVQPQDANEVARMAARGGELLFDYYWQHLDLEDELTTAMLYERLWGNGYWFITWDPSVGTTLDVVAGKDGSVMKAGRDGEPDDSGTPIVASFKDARFERVYKALGGKVPIKKLYQGDIKVEALTPYEVFVEPSAIRLKEAKWVCKGKVWQRKEAEDRYGVKLQTSPEMYPKVMAGWYHYMRDTQGFGPHGQPQDLVAIYESWFLPGQRDYPDGGRVIWSQEKIIHEEAVYPYKHGELPIVEFSADQMAMSFYAGTPIDDIRSMNYELNKLMSQLIENALRIGNPPLLLSKYSRFNWRGKPGEQAVYEDNTPNSVPRYLEPPQLPGWLQKLPDALTQGMREVTGSQEVTVDNIPRDISAAASISMLNETAMLALKPALKDLERGLQRGGRQVLSLFQQFVTWPRAVSIIGANHEFWAQALKGTDIHTDLRVEAGSGTPKSIAGRQQAIQSVIQAWVQLRKEPTDAELSQLFKAMEFGDVLSVYSNVNTEEDLVQHEIRSMIETSEPYKGDPQIDNHPRHYELHSGFEKTEPFRRLPRITRDAMKVHREWHAAMIERDNLKQQMGTELQTLDQEQQDLLAQLPGREQSTLPGGGDRNGTRRSGARVPPTGGPNHPPARSAERPSPDRQTT